MSTADVYAALLVVRAGWGVWTLSRALKFSPVWSRLRVQIVAVETLFIPACLLPAAALHWGTFSPWMAAPLGACFLLIIPLPCYWEAVDRIRWLHAARNALFVLLALVCFAIALRWLPLAAVGL
jgi:hypothetical protein